MSLIEVAQKLLALNPDAVELFKKANGKLWKYGQTPAFIKSMLFGHLPW